MPMPGDEAAELIKHIRKNEKRNQRGGLLGSLAGGRKASSAKPASVEAQETQPQQSILPNTVNSDGVSPNVQENGQATVETQPVEQPNAHQSTIEPNVRKKRRAS